MRPTLTLFACLALVGCGDRDRTASGTDAGPAMDDGAMPTPSDGGTEECNAPDTECPVDPPVNGGPCETGLECEYDDGSIAQCMDGTWRSYGCPGCAPPLAEGCRDPFDGTLDGASVSIGPYSPTEAFRPFEDGERIAPSFGAQGGSMVQFRVQVDHATPPQCAMITVDVSIDGTASAPATFPLQLHCGDSLGVFTILAEDPCDETHDYDVELDVEIAGVGSVSKSLVMGGSACPGPAG